MADYTSGNFPLNSEQMHQNALYIAKTLSTTSFYGIPKWSLNAIAGLLGNTQSESRHNPGAWQDYTAPEAGDDPSKKGYGLVQWTPYTKYFEWAAAGNISPSSMDTALQRLNYEAANHIQYYPTSAYPDTFLEFIESTKAPDYLGRAFLYNYERPLEPDPVTRGKQALYWFEYISGHKFKGKKKWMYYLKRKVVL